MKEKLKKATRANGRDTETGEFVEVNWKHFLTGVDDRTINNITFLSRPSEVHAAAVGIVAVVAPSIVGLPPTAAVTGAGMYVLGRTVKRWAKSSNLHLRDAAEEPAYFALGYALMSLIMWVAQFV